jgi:dTMP kinase
MRGAYIIIEGVVGTGKSTQSKILFEFLKKEFPNKEVILTREPGGDEIAEAIRKIVQGTVFRQKMTEESEAYLYAAARAQSLRTVVKPVLDRGGIVVSDRSFISSLAYQGYARGLGIKRVMEINKEAVDGILPNIILYIDLDPAIGVKRTFDKSGDKFEKEDLAFFKKIEQGYKEVSKLDNFREIWQNIDGTGDKDSVSRRIRDCTISFLQQF